MAAIAAICLLSTSISSRAEEAVPPQGDVDRIRAALDKARATKKQADAEKARAYLKAHLLYKNCEREFRPFCLLSAQTMMRHADARRRYREMQEFPNIAAMEAAIAAGNPAGALQNCGKTSCAKVGK